MKTNLLYIRWEGNGCPTMIYQAGVWGISADQMAGKMVREDMANSIDNLMN